MTNNSKKCYYEILEITKEANEDDIKKAYRRLAKIYHPDKNHEDTSGDKFKEINEAYTILSDPQTKMKYDNQENINEPNQEDLFQQLFRNMNINPFMNVQHININPNNINPFMNVQHMNINPNNINPFMNVQHMNINPNNINPNNINPNQTFTFVRFG